MAFEFVRPIHGGHSTVQGLFPSADVVLNQHNDKKSPDGKGGLIITVRQSRMKQLSWRAGDRVMLGIDWGEKRLMIQRVTADLPGFSLLARAGGKRKGHACESYIKINKRLVEALLLELQIPCAAENVLTSQDRLSFSVPGWK